VNEYALRLVPLIAGVLLLVVLWRLARALLGPPEGLFVVILAAVSLLLVYHSNEFKQYGIDAAVAGVLLAETARFLEAGPSRSWWRLGGAGAVALMCSQPALFLLVGVGAALLLDRSLSHQLRGGGPEPDDAAVLGRRLSGSRTLARHPGGLRR
jgi:predicted membrane-bound mannosyltransferase